MARPTTLERETESILISLAEFLTNDTPVHPGALLTDSDKETAAQTIQQLADAWRAHNNEREKGGAR